MGMTPTHEIGRFTPDASLLPLSPALWFPFDTATGTTSTSTTSSGFPASGAASMLTGNATLTVISGTMSLPSGGGFKFGADLTTSNQYFAFDPAAGPIRDNLVTMFNLGSYAVGERLLVGYDLFVPTGYNATNAGSAVVLGIGDTSTSGWFCFGWGSGELPNVRFRSVGAAATATLSAGSGLTAFVENAWQSIVMELECTATNTFKVRAATVKSGAATLGTFSAATNFSTSDGSGTACPGVAAGNGIRIGANKNASSTEGPLRHGVILRNVWALRTSYAVQDTIALSIARDMQAQPFQLPLTVRRIARVDPGVYETVESTGSATFTFAPVTDSDMYIAQDGDIALASQPRFTVFLEPGNTRNTDNLSGYTGWTSDASGEYINRLNTSIGGVKFGRMESSPGSEPKGSFLLSSYTTDTNKYPVREEMATNGSAVQIIKRRDMWIAGRYYLDFQTALPTGEWVIVLQLKPNPSTSPPININFYGSRVDIVYAYNPADYLPYSYQATESAGDKIVQRGVAVGADWIGKWFDVVIHCNIDDLNQGGGFCKIWFDDILLSNYVGPLGFGGLVSGESRRIYNVRWSNYPSVTPWTGGKRDVWVRRCFVCKDEEGYSLAQIRAALVA